jgi:hypothetical protein
MSELGKLLLAIVLCCLGIAGMYAGGPIERPPGVLIEADPVQSPTRAPSFRVGEFDLLPQADYDIAARVLSVETYQWDGGAKLSPIDFAVGWGAMSDSAVLEHFRITQGGRYFTIYPDEQAIDVRDALLSSANMHLIPASAAVQGQLARARPGSLVRLQGKLVNASREDGYRWNSSLTRADSGGGACELFYVESVELR